MNELIAARLELIAAKAKILAASYRENKLWDGELNSGLDMLSHEIVSIRQGGNRPVNDYGPYGSGHDLSER